MDRRRRAARTVALMSLFSMTDTLENVPVASFDGDGSDLISLIVGIEPIQAGSGDPSPDNVRPISGWTGANIHVSPTTDAEDGTTYSITFPTEAGTVYGGTLDVTTGKLTVDRALFEATSDNLNGLIEGASSTNDWLVVSKSRAFPNTDGSKRDSSICSHAPYKFANVDGTTHFYVTTNGFWLAVPKSAYPTFADFTNSLTGNNVLRCVMYIATPIVYDLTPTQVTTLIGTNNIWADTGDIKYIEYNI